MNGNDKVHLRRPAAWLLAALVAAAPLALGCAGTQREELLEIHASAYVFHRPQLEVVASARRLLEEKDFELNPLADGEILRTEWKTVSGGDDEFVTAYERYVLLIRRLTPEHCRVQAVRLTASTGGMETYHPHTPFTRNGSGATVNTAHYGRGRRPLMLGRPNYSRDLELEWELIRRVEPQRADLIQATVNWQLGARAGR